MKTLFILGDFVAIDTNESIYVSECDNPPPLQV